MCSCAGGMHRGGSSRCQALCAWGAAAITAWGFLRRCSILTLGHSAHFGLGQFMSAGEQHEM
ncbi:protein of unknown function [Candidatus Nitrospira inopinata]|uniref:Uncharacterized protein n=1 Tax=Candidatus Nitrospira inopinata TaxID=1715989 RepID=A0A0S4L0E2_9BACT|nr:protein of unknown function [Candidatus Nitrospira inopinata]